MADLPKECFSNDPCFHPFWARYVWTFFIKGEEVRIKHYGKMASRSVHIEIMHSLDANSFIHSFIQVFRHFIAYCGNIQTLCSDKRSKFIGAEYSLQGIGVKMCYMPDTSCYSWRAKDG